MGEANEGMSRFVDEVACCFGLSSIDGWQWIKQGEWPAVAAFHADNRRFVARLFADETAAPQAEYISQLGLHLASVGVEVEEVVRTASGEPFARLTSGVPVILSRYYTDRPMTLPLEAEGAQVWGRYVSVLHNACRDWPAPSPLPSRWVREHPGAILRRALDLARSSSSFASILAEASGRIIRCWEETPAIQPVHGDLWPGHLLGGPHGLMAIDFADAGDGPRTIDLATAFRWMPWRDDPAGATILWDAWLVGYAEAGTLSQAEFDAVPQVACLQHLIWLEAEVGTAPGEAESSWYVEDHCTAIQALLAAS